MSSRRMFNRTLLESDSFSGLPPRQQILYIFLCLNADDEGFINNPVSVIRSHCLARRDLEGLITSGYVLRIRDSMLLIAHWCLHNKIRRDRCQSVIDTELSRQIFVTREGFYTLDRESSSRTLYDELFRPETNDGSAQMEVLRREAMEKLKAYSQG